MNDLIEYLHKNCNPFDSLILKGNKNLSKVLENWIGKKWKSQYRGSRDGFTAQKFHSLCDNKGEALFIAEDINGYIFGGYTSVGWKSLEGWINDQNAFLFTLKNPHNIPPTKYSFKSNYGSYSVYDSSSYLPTFGGGHDMHTSDNCNENTANYFSFPNSYSDTTGFEQSTFTGNYNWRAKEVEVFIVSN